MSVERIRMYPAFAYYGYDAGKLETAKKQTLTSEAISFEGEKRDGRETRQQMQEGSAENSKEKTLEEHAGVPQPSASPTGVLDIVA